MRLWEKGDYTYLVHHNSEKKKVVIRKLNQDEPARFSNLNPLCVFSAKVPALVHIPTPLGTLAFSDKTLVYL